ncbi:MAG: BLUF domain-containing protein [Sphingobium sp.]
MYISSTRVPMSVAQCRSIVQTSRINNRRADVTGLLLFNSRRFLQVLEGPEAAVKQTFERICADDRHHGVVTLRTRDLSMREFGEWAMAFDDPEEAAGATLQEKVSELLAHADASTRAQFEVTALMHRAS